MRACIACFYTTRLITTSLPLTRYPSRVMLDGRRQDCRCGRTRDQRPGRVCAGRCLSAADAQLHQTDDVLDEPEQVVFEHTHSVRISMLELVTSNVLLALHNDIYC